MHVARQFISVFTTTAIVVILAITNGGNATLPETIKWTGGNFEWPCPTTKNMFKSSGKYISKNVIATRVALYTNNAIVALPRYKAGIPVTLAKISQDVQSCEATLVPYPCWSLQEEGTCTALQNVVDIYLDPQNILWVLDTGVVNTLDEPMRRCPPKILAVNVVTGKLVKTVDLTGLTSSASRLQYLVSDYSQDGRVFVYASDAASRAILVYDVTLGRGYRVVLPQAVAMGTTRRDVLYLALLRRSDGSTCLIFTYLSSSRLFSIRTEHLRSGSANGKIHDLGMKPKKMIFLGTDNGSALFFRYEGEPDVYRWDAVNPFVSRCFDKVYTSAECSLVTHVVADYARGRMRVLESNFPDYMQGSVGCGATQALNVM
ncbi:major royal jelly protein 5 [Bombus impatiens]|uniref:Major royal jelly protein 5 n=1 Tax=Bombus impatiens TaxID=132113 RepID=A0A6P3E362_BOMIM|nr:major royal jelly protein 5 [Bombus impatiens]